MFFDDEEAPSYYKFLKNKRNVKDELWEDYKSLNISNGYTPIELDDYEGEEKTDKEDE